MCMHGALFLSHILVKGLLHQLDISLLIELHRASYFSAF